MIVNQSYYTLFVIALLSLRVVSHIKCNIYPYSAKDCIQKTEEIRCQYDQFYNTCVDNKKINLGCSVYLNREACLSQLTDDQNNRVQCIFRQKCTSVKQVQLQQYGCSKMFNKYACLNVEKYSCTWQNNRCQSLNQNIQGNQNICNIFTTPVNSFTCTQLPNGLCMSSEYECIELRLEQLSQLSCYEQGLNEQGCLAINKENQYCIFKDNKCMEIKLTEIKSCDQNFSQSLCLSIKNPYIQCEWVDQKCIKFEKNSEFQCVTQNLVNVSVCQMSTGLCQYDEKKHKCINIEKNLMNLIQCDTPGLSRLGCLSINNQQCSFIKGRCQELSELDLNFFQCHMELNKLACINIKTSFQYCFWNGINCERRVINQDYDCPLKFDNKQYKVNGNVCQAISKYNIKCKYNQQTNLCIESSQYDICETPYINKFGCLSIIKSNITCQWTNQGCKDIQIIQYLTTCISLGSANPIACSQIHEQNENIGCYFDMLKQQCVLLTLQLDSNATKNQILQYQKDLEFLRNINCKEIQQGLNRIACSSITNRDVACMWKRNQCVQIENIKEISQIPCQLLQYSNYKVCSYASFEKEVCRYNHLLKGCVNSIFPNIQCNEPGLNSFGCLKAEGKCQFINDSCQKSDYEQQIEYQDSLKMNQKEPPLSCESTSPTKAVCISFTAPSLKCVWRKSNGFCESIEIEENQYCLDFSGPDISVNPNVCAAVKVEFSDYNYQKGINIDKYRGYCYYNQQTRNCQIKKEQCNTKCCTEKENDGINAHSCSKFSSDEPGLYCFFKDLRCQELTNKIVDISYPYFVQLYYNENKLPCSSMNKNSCYMINWSIEQLCYHNGIICQNVNFKYYKNYRIFIEEPSVLNEYACYAIDGKITEFNTLKYIGYDNVNKRCLEILFNEYDSYHSCSSAKGNRNVCQRYSGNNYCKWDQKQLKCVSIPYDEYDEIQQCDSELNIYACTNLKNNSCLFSYHDDKCMKVNDFKVDCNHFQSLGKVSQLVCLQIDKIGQQCEFKNYQCVDSTNYSSFCYGSFANNRSCFKNTRGLCRWDPNTFQCYENNTNIDQLSCSDNINITLCKLITKESCVWNDISNQCEVFKTLSSTEFEIYNIQGNYKLSEKACLLITGDAYYYDIYSQSCTKLIYKTVDCNAYKMNKYACLYHTQTHNCFYDEGELKNSKCKQFSYEQSICSTQWMINIEVCMNIYRPCIFDVKTLSCQSFEFQETLTCSDLSNYSINLQHPNRRVCSSVVQTLEETSGELQCLQDKQNKQQCKYEKYCFWIDYSCQIFQLVYDYYDSSSGQQQTTKECPDFQKIDTCFDEIIQDEQSYGKKKQEKVEINWIPSNEYCSKKIIKYYREHVYYQLSDNLNVCKIKECSIIEELICNFHTIIETIIPMNEVIQDNYDSSTYEVKVIDNAEVTCQNMDCSFQSEYNCNIEKSICSREQTCQTNIINPYNQVIQNNCSIQNKYVLGHWCLLEENKVNICSKDYSKGMCLELGPKCYFNPEQGGCMQLEGNEHNIGDCSQIANNCYVSASHRAICQNGELSIKPGDKCKSVQIAYITCIPLTTYQSPYNCSDILDSDAQPILCAKANDDCRYDGKICINSIPDKCDSGGYLCDKSFSKSLCEKCGCIYTYFGYCQRDYWITYINQDYSNKYFQCYQVDLLDTINKMKICTKVNQACAYVDNNCHDATHYSCSDLFKYHVSFKACMNCQENATMYDYDEKKCLNIDDIPNQNTCSHYLNQKACFRKTEGVQCRWNGSSCEKISPFYQNSSSCSNLNFDACYAKKVNDCWIDYKTSLCVQYDPYQGKCNLLKTESLCFKSMYENCQWIENKCIQNNDIPINRCDNLNQYQCLNTINIACGWSTSHKKCYKLYFRSDQYQCNYFLSYDLSQLSIDTYNSYTCTQIKASYGCIHDQQQYKCRQIIPTDVLSCEESSISNINEYACVRLTIGLCKFVDNQCQNTNESNLGCQSYLNQQACLIQDAACKFDNYCQSYVIKYISEINTVFPYTQSVCLAVDFQVGLSLIYSVVQQKCIDITKKNMIQDCNYIGMNKQSCLLKTNQYCEFIENECRKIEIKVIQQLKTCKPTLNQYTCTKLKVDCKFLNNQCVPINDKDNCITLSKEKSIVNIHVCLNDRENPCKFDDITQNCQLITTNQKCSNINKKACIFFTKGSNCEYKEYKCITSFGSSNCIDNINEDKCLSSIKKGQLCYFDKQLGCQNIDITKVNLNKCYKNGLQTNPNTCSRSTDIPCFFDKQSKQCIQYTQQTQYSYQENYSLSNIYSLNKLACQMFNQQKALRWQNYCQIVGSSQLVYLKCSNLLNKIACLSIKTPQQYCQYQNNKCINANLDDFKNVSCDSIRDINSGVFCALNKNQIPCEFNQSLFKCQVIVSTSIRCVENNPHQKGFNQKACEIDKTNCNYDENCYRLNNSGYQFCRDIKVNGQYQCKQVKGQGCMIQQNICKQIYYQDYSQIQCEQAINRFGCVNIQTKDQYCQFDGDSCLLQDVSQYQVIGCLSIVNINSYIFCEQAQDIPCTFDLINNSCRNVYQYEEFSCERGLNKLACLNQTDKELMCKFLEHCYGPNNGIMNCTHNDKNVCCREADSIETCLYQKIYECEWTENGCQASQTRIQLCDEIINASFLVCASIKYTFCVFVPSQKKCKSEIPTTCGLSQLSQQCKRMISISCIWDSDEEICKYSEESIYLDCSQVTERSGNQRACMNIEVNGQMCIFKNEQCVLFVQQENTNNCLDTMNKNACLKQTISHCQWIDQVYTVRKYQNYDEEDVIQGECRPITNLHQLSCSSNLSYTACLNITKFGQYCIWQDSICQTISQQQLYTPNQLIYVNVNACGLVNNGDIVRYDEEFRKCVIIQNPDELTCNPEIIGINKDACLTIKTQLCVWNTNQKRCQQQNNLVESQSCEKPDWNVKSCQQFNINQPCGYSINGCQFVDINSITCTHAGLNKFACLNIQKYPCIWKLDDQNNNYYCDDYIPYTSCELVPINVNFKVCQLVDQDGCYYDITNNKCENINLSQVNCDTLGLNIIGCIEIDGCVFQEYCQPVKKQQFYNCKDYPIANYKVCMNANDTCKFNELTSGCSDLREDLCNAKGLSEQGCNLNKQCTFINNQCLCNSIKDKDCNQINNVEQCNSLDHCIYFNEQNQCKWKQCEDLSLNNCDGQHMNQQYCYLNTLQQCKSAKQCEDIQNPNNQICPKINNKSCINNQELKQCQLLICEILNEDECQSNSNCQWIKLKSFCTDTPCRYLKNTFQCNGVQIKKKEQICVQLSDNTCVSCEEISSPCICLQNNNYCDYNFKEMKCYSKVCENYKMKEYCPELYCQYFNQTCIQKCELLEQCNNNYCNGNDKVCKTINTTLPLENKIYGELIEFLLLSMLILYL